MVLIDLVNMAMFDLTPTICIGCSPNYFGYGFLRQLSLDFFSLHHAHYITVLQKFGPFHQSTTDVQCCVVTDHHFCRIGGNLWWNTSLSASIASHTSLHEILFSVTALKKRASIAGLDQKAICGADASDNAVRQQQPWFTHS